DARPARSGARVPFTPRFGISHQSRRHAVLPGRTSLPAAVSSLLGGGAGGSLMGIPPAHHRRRGSARPHRPGALPMASAIARLPLVRAAQADRAAAGGGTGDRAAARDAETA